jgi:hypothetical protein
MARVKGRGIDCVMLLLETFERAGLIAHREVDFYSPRVSERGNSEMLMKILLEYARKVGAPLPGDVALYRIEKRPAHLAFVIQWPSVVHANARAGTILDDGETNRALKKRFLGFYRFNEWE